MLILSGWLGCTLQTIREMPASDYAFYKAYYRIEPFGIRREDWHHSKTQTMLAESMQTVVACMGRKGSRKNYKASDFMYKRKKTNEQKAKAFMRALDLMIEKAKLQNG